MSLNTKPAMLDRMFTNLELIARELPDAGEHRLIHKVLTKLRMALKTYFRITTNARLRLLVPA
tara:strand:+ start:189 stop:377 length:189 start_codon:yes stop_codon:yes gene_type:complete